MRSTAAATWGSDLCTALHWALDQNGSRVSTLARRAGMTKAATRDALKGQRELEQGHIARAREQPGMATTANPSLIAPRRGGHAHIRVLWSRGSESEAGGERHIR